MESQQKFAVFDIDGTLIRWQLYHVLVEWLAKDGALGEEAEKILEDARKTRNLRTETNAFDKYDDVLVEIYEDAIQNISPQLFDQMVLDVIEQYKDESYSYTRQLIQELKDKGYRLFIISGSHMELIEQIAKYYGFDDWVGTYYERDDNGFTGKVKISTLAKDKSLQILLDRNEVTMTDSVAIGDSGGDIPMLKMVENPIVFNPDNKLYQEAKAQGWKIVLERKNVIYELESKDGQYVLAKANPRPPVIS